MTVTCTGAEMNAFMTDPEVWPDGYWWDDAYVEVNGEQHDLNHSFQGKDVLDANVKILVQGGEYHIGSEVNSTFFSFETTLKKWLDKRRVTIIVLEVDNDQLDSLRQYLDTLFGVGVKMLK